MKQSNFSVSRVWGKKLLNRPWYLLLIASILLFTACKEEEVASNECQQELDTKNFQQVADNLECSTYQRASANLGLAGFLFTNFLEDGASDNFRHTLRIPDDVQDWQTSQQKKYYDQAKQLTGDSSGDMYEGQTRPKEDTEIHYFASLASLLAQTYIELDTSANGKVEESEIQSFTKIQPKTTTGYGENKLVVADWFQFVAADNIPRLFNVVTGKCQYDDSSSDYDFNGVWSADSSADILDTACGLFSPVQVGLNNVSGQCNVIIKVESLQQMFVEGAADSSGDVTDFLTGFVQNITGIVHDLDSLKIPADNELRSSLNEIQGDLDNGGKCNTEDSQETDQILKLVSVSSKDTANSYKELNTLKTTDVLSSSDNNPTIPTTFLYSSGSGPGDKTVVFSCNNADAMDARLIFNSASGYIANYGDASNDIKNTFSTLDNMIKDKDGQIIPTKAGDNKISFEELLCMK